MADQFQYKTSTPKSSFMDFQNNTQGGVQGMQSLNFMKPGVGLNSVGSVGDSGLSPNGLTSINAPAVDTFGMNAPGAGPQLPGVGGGPDVMGKWTKGVGMAKDIAGIGLGIYNAMETSKMNKFMKGYYGDKMAMERTDFANAAQDANYRLENRERSRNSARGIAYDSDEMKQNLASTMDKWGAKETF